MRGGTAGEGGGRPLPPIVPGPGHQDHDTGQFHSHGMTAWSEVDQASLTLLCRFTLTDSRSAFGFTPYAVFPYRCPSLSLTRSSHSAARVRRHRVDPDGGS